MNNFSFLLLIFISIVFPSLNLVGQESALNQGEELILGKQKVSEIHKLMEEFKIKGVGVGVITNGVLNETGYYGEQNLGTPISKKTMFNVASTTKAITAEVFLRLAAKGEVSLDEPISDYYVYSDIVDDERHKLLTPRIILTHQTGFRNWPWEYEDGKLAFDHDPGSKFGYSGVGFYILAKFLEEKLWVSFPHLVEEIIFKPLRMENSSIVEASWFDGQRPSPVGQDGEYFEEYNQMNGYWNPADDLHVTVEDYAKFLVSSMNKVGLTEELAIEREKIISDLTEDPIFGTKDSTKDVFYTPAYGYGLGWMVFDYGDGNKNIQHGGNDQGEASMAYFHTKSKNGLIIFCSGGNGVLMLPHMADLLDEEQKYSSVYHHIIDKFFTK